VLPTRYGHTDFYAAAAQVIPVLLLAIVFEQRLFRQRVIPTVVVATMSSITVGAFVIAEAVSMRVLYRGYAHREDQIWVIAPLLLGAILLIIPIVLPPAVELNRSGKRIQNRFALGVTGFVALIVILVLLELFKQ
jgi:hypothetical protein